MLTVTDLAKTKILELRKNEKRDDLALRFGIDGRGPNGFVYKLKFVEPGDQQSTDSVVDAGEIKVLVDEESSPNLKGATLDFVEGPEGSGFKIDNPNPLWSDEKAMAVQRVIDEKINPAVAMHGGFVSLLDVKDGSVYVQLGGGCQGCGMVDVTLKQGIEVMIREAVPDIREVIDQTDHAGGNNPYYQPSKGGGPSPLSG